MISRGKQILVYGALTVIGLYFLFEGLAKAQGFLAPLFTAIFLALLVLPLSQKMESSFMNRMASSLLNTFIIFAVSVGFMALISFQVKNVVDDWDQIKETMKPKIEQLQDWVLEHTPVEEQDLQRSEGSTGEQVMSSGSGSNAGKAASFFNAVITFFADYLLTFIYIFFLLNYRHRFKGFLLRLFPEQKQKEVGTTINEAAKVTQQYLVGKIILIGLLAVLYGIGLGVSGVDNFILISILAAFLSLVPYIGNIVGFMTALTFGYLTSGETGVLIGIIITFSVAQFVESYVLEPYVVGDQVDLHPFLVILAVIVGGMVWGVIGMILAIPMLAIVNVIFIHVASLNPFAYLFSKKNPFN